MQKGLKGQNAGKDQGISGERKEGRTTAKGCQMKTSYFSKPGIKTDIDAVSIARFTPKWWGVGRRYLPLAPSNALLQAYKADKINWIEYVDRYESETLEVLDPEMMYETFQNKILCCWCGPKDFKRCHRRLVAGWIERSLGIEVPEL